MKYIFLAIIALSVLACKSSNNSNKTQDANTDRTELSELNPTGFVEETGLPDDQPTNSGQEKATIKFQINGKNYSFKGDEVSLVGDNSKGQFIFFASNKDLIMSGALNEEIGQKVLTFSFKENNLHYGTSFANAMNIKETNGIFNGHFNGKLTNEMDESDEIIIKNGILVNFKLKTK